MSMEVERFDVEKYRERLRKMTDQQLLREGLAANYMCSPAARYTKAPRSEFVIQLEEARAEWRRRHPKA
jgi:hypothetical protein